MGSSESKPNQETTTQNEREKWEREDILKVVGAAAACAVLSWGIYRVFGSDDKKMMKAPGKSGEYIRRDVFEKDPKGYFRDLHNK